ncbi:MAG: protein-tyrosine-phosphatase [Solirubrobacterales bacterium]|nr:protein-tyrosine-phosphatase [Solirubrobacterales bacterium]
MDGVHDKPTVTTTIPLDGAVNARDVAGIPLSGGGAIAPGVLLRSDNLQDLTPADIATLVEEHEVRVVVDLRTTFERRSEGPGPLEDDPRVRIEHRSLYPETGGGTDLDLTTVKPWGDSLGGADVPGESPTVRAYLGYLQRRPDSIVDALRIIATTDGATLVHCAAGKDRTGVVVAFALAAAGATHEAIAADYLTTADNIDGIVARLASTRTYSSEVRVEDVASHTPQPGAMERVLELVFRDHGGVEAWLARHGLSDDELAALRERLTAGA